VAGGTVRIPILFRLPSDPPSDAPPAPRSPEALREGQRLADAMGVVDKVVQLYGEHAHQIETTDEGAVSGAARAGAAGALRQAVEAHRGELRDAYARAFAATFSEEEMAAIAAFETAHGKEMESPQVAAQQPQVLAGSLHLLREAGHAASCGKHDCGSPESLQRVWRPADPKDPRIDNPQWDLQPDAATMAAAEPEVMTILGLSGAVRLSCKVAADGTLKDCKVDEEAPVGFGFGRAALGLAGSYRLARLQLAAGGAGKTVTVRIGFSPPELGAAYAAPAPRSPQALAAARQIVAGTGVVEQARLETELQIAGYESKPPPGADPKIYADVIAAYREGAAKALADFAENIARVWAAAYSDQQLTTFQAFFESPAGKAQEARNAALNIAVEHALTPVHETIAAEARKIYCATHDCLAAPKAQSSTAKPEASTRKP
jgi:hypothetical protein